MKPKICVDFDGVIHPGFHGLWAKDYDDPIEGACHFMNCIAEDFYIIIHSCRTSRELCFQYGVNASDASNILIRWLKRYEIPFDKIHRGFGKPIASAYIDDHAVLCRPLHDKVAYRKCLESISHLRPPV